MNIKVLLKVVVHLSDSGYHRLYQQENLKCYLQEFKLPREEG